MELFYIGMPVVRRDGRSVGVRSRDYQNNFLGWVDLPSYGAALARAWSSAIKPPSSGLILSYRNLRKY